MRNLWARYLASTALVCCVCACLVACGNQRSARALTVSTVGHKNNKVAFGKVLVGNTSSQPVELNNTGSVPLTIASVSLSGPGFRVTALSTPLTIVPGNRVSVMLTFIPTSPGAASGTVSLLDSTGRTLTDIAVQGTGTVPAGHAVLLSWGPQDAGVVGYNVYRGARTGGPYSKINPVLQLNPSYTDVSVRAGQTYYYVVTAVSAHGESGFSQESVADIPAS